MVALVKGWFQRIELIRDQQVWVWVQDCSQSSDDVRHAAREVSPLVKDWLPSGLWLRASSNCTPPSFHFALLNSCR